MGMRTLNADEIVESRGLGSTFAFRATASSQARALSVKSRMGTKLGAEVFGNTRCIGSRALTCGLAGSELALVVRRAGVQRVRPNGKPNCR